MSGTAVGILALAIALGLVVINLILAVRDAANIVNKDTEDAKNK